MTPCARCGGRLGWAIVRRNQAVHRPECPTASSVTTTRVAATHCSNCGEALNGPRSPGCIEWHELTAKKYYASPFGHLFCIDCGTETPSGTVRCTPCVRAKVAGGGSIPR
jgi:hypothetical protein